MIGPTGFQTANCPPPERELMSLALEVSAAPASGEGRKIKGYANTFRVMRSGRVILPSAADAWLQSAGNVERPLLAQHGMVGGFATIGKVTKFRVDRSRGLYFEGELASDLPLADEAWALVQQGMLKQISLGWWPLQARWVRADDSDLDPWLKKVMKEANVSECYAHMQIEVAEVSIVDLADDRGAFLAAAGGAAAVAELAAGIRDIRGRLDKLHELRGEDKDGQPLGETLAAIVRAQVKQELDAFLPELRKAALEVLESAALCATTGDTDDDPDETTERTVSPAAKSSAPTDPPAAETSAEIIARAKKKLCPT